jgi:putative ABC transport system permease protein
LLSLSWQNIRRNRQAYLPYALSCAGAAAMYFIMLALSNTPTLMDVYGGRTIQRTLAFGTQVMLIFSVVFVFYTHSFLMKRRGREMALFHMLGMDKRHLMLVTGSETLLIALASTLLGVGPRLTHESLSQAHRSTFPHFIPYMLLRTVSR